MLPLRSTLLALAGLVLISPSFAQCPDEDHRGGVLTTFELFANPVTETGLTIPTTDVNHTDFYHVTIEAGETVHFRVDFTHVQADLSLQIRRGSTLLASADDSIPVFINHEEIVYTNFSGATETYTVRVINDTEVLCSDYSITAFRSVCPDEDVLAGFNTCSSPYGLATESGEFSALASLDGVNDYFSVVVGPGESFRGKIHFAHAIADLDLFLYDAASGGCGTQVDSSESTTNVEIVEYENASRESVTLITEVALYNSTGTCNNYTFDWLIFPAEDCYTPDALEGNDDICSPTALVTPGVIDALTITENDDDFYDLGTIAPGQSVTIGIDFAHADGDIDVELFDVTAGCVSSFTTMSSTSTDDYEEIRYVNNSLSSIALTARVFLYEGACNTYSMSYSYAQPGVIGGWICNGQANSSGSIGFAQATGSSLALDNDVTLSASGLPTNQFGIFVASQTWELRPGAGGSQGTLCLGGSIGRYNTPGSILSSGSQGEVSLPIDLTMIPQPSQFVSAAPGETWYFQFWHRDIVGGSQTSNYAVATRIRFE